MASGFRSHKAKNHTNAYMTRVTEEELEARKRGDWKESAAAFDKFKKRFHQEMNTAKNASLYVDFRDAKFSTPSEMVTDEVLNIFWGLNQYFLQATFPYLRLLKRIEDDDGTFQKVVQLFVGKVDGIREKMGEDPYFAKDGVLNEMLKVYQEEHCDKDLSK